MIPAVIVAATLSGGGHPNSNLPGRHHEDDLNLIAFSSKGGGGAIEQSDLSPTIMGTNGNGGVPPAIIAEAYGGNNTSGSIEVAAARSSRGNRYDFETDTFIVSHPLRASDGHHGWSGGRGDGGDNLIAFQPNSSRTDEEWRENETPPIKKGSGGLGAVPPAFAGPQGVRRLTPLECERLQGFPDGWTATTADGKPIADAHRYRMLGNAVATVVAQWLGYRLAWVDANA